ncbi:hypothetical protein D9M68_957700 [compost metagenome]
MQSRRPAAGELVDLVKFLGAEFHGRQVVLEESAGFYQVEGQRGAIEIHQLAAEAQPAEAQRRPYAGGNHVVQVVRAVV